MGILGELLKGKRKIEVEMNKDELMKEPLVETRPYNRYWLERVAQHNDFSISENDRVVDNILDKLNKRDGHCPCGGMTDEFICPCRMMREYGKCKCGLYNSAVDLNPRNSSSAGKIKEE